MSLSFSLSRPGRALPLAALLLGLTLLGAVSARPAHADTLTRTSTTTSGAQADHASVSPELSADGRYVAFTSLASDLVADDTNGKLDVFVKDTLTGQTTRVSTQTGGAQSNNTAAIPHIGASAISGDGRYVVFYSNAPDLVPGDTNLRDDVFVKDMQTGTTTRVSTATDGAESTGGGSYNPAISPDGRYVVFSSDAGNLVADDNNGTDNSGVGIRNGGADVFVKDTQTGQTTRVSTRTGGSQLTEGLGYFASNSVYPEISGGGRYVTFVASNTDLVPGDTNGNPDVFVKDTQTDTTTRVSTKTGGDQAIGTAGSASDVRPTISADGRYVAFTSSANDLVAGDTNASVLGADVFVKDMQTDTTTRVSTGTGGTESIAGGGLPAISADGRYIAFASLGPDLVAGDTNAKPDVFVKDTQTGTTTRVSTTAADAQGNNSSSTPAISADGRTVAFASGADNLVSGDTNAWPDVFNRTLQAPTADGEAATLSGGALVGGTLTATAGGGFTGAWPHGAISFQWERCDADLTGCATIAGASGTSYTLTAADADRRVRAVEAVSNLLGAVRRPGQASATVDIDTDSDGTGNRADADDDGDGVADADDAFPLDPTRGKPEAPQPEPPTQPQPPPVIKPTVGDFPNFTDAAQPVSCPAPGSVNAASNDWVALIGSSRTPLGTTTAKALTGGSQPGVWRCVIRGTENGQSVEYRSLPVLISGGQRSMLTREEAKSKKLRDPELLSSGTQKLSVRLYQRVDGTWTLGPRATRFDQTVKTGTNRLAYSRHLRKRLKPGRYKVVIRAYTGKGTLTAALVQEITIG